MASRMRWIARPFRKDYSPRLLPWFEFASGTEDIDRVHRIALDARCDKPQRWRRALAWISALTWPVRSVSAGIRAVRAHGGLAAEQGGGSPLHQLLLVLWLANRQNIAPSSFYKLALFRPERRRDALKFVQHHEITRLLVTLIRHVDRTRVDDKCKFYRFCRSVGIATPEVYACFEAEQERWGTNELPPRDLVLKPTQGFGGRGVERWRHRADRPNRSTWEHDHERLDEPGLRARALSLARPSGVILQEAIEVAPDLRMLSAVGISTLRVVSCHFPSQAPQILVRVFRMPTGDSFTDNFATGGIAAGVASDGRLGSACRKYPSQVTLSQHPDTGAQIEGFELPPQLLSEAEHICLRAHEALRDFPFIGWDVVLGDRGAMIIEGNLIPCADLSQAPSGVPLGDSSFAACYLSWFIPPQRGV